MTAAVPEQEREHSPGGVPQPPADQAEQAPVVEVAHRQEPEEERRPEGVPAGQLAVGGLSAVALAVTGVWALVGVPGLLVAGGLAAGAGALYVRRRLGLGGRRRRREQTVTRTVTAGRTGGRSGGLGGLLGGKTGRGRSGGAGGAGKAAGGRLGGPAGRSASRMPGLGGRAAGRVGAARTGAVGKSGGRSGGAVGRVGAARGGAGRGWFGGLGRLKSKGAPAAGGKSTGGQAGKAGGSKSGGSSGGQAGGGAVRRGPVGRAAQAARKAAGWVNAATGGRAGRAVRAAVRTLRTVGGQAGPAVRKAAAWVDAKSGGRAGRVVAAWRTRKSSPSASRSRWAVRGTVAGVVCGVAMGLPVWLLAVGAAACGGAAWWLRRRSRRASRASSASQTGQTGQAARSGRSAAPSAPSVSSAVAALPGGAGQAPKPGPAGQPASGQVPASVVRLPGGAGRAGRGAAAGAAGAAGRRGPYRVGGRRALPAGSPRVNRRNRMTQIQGGFPLATIAAELNAAAAAYEPPDMWTVSTDLKQLPDVFVNVALALRTYTQRLEGQYPIDQAVVQEIGQLYTGLAQLAQAAQGVEPLFRQVHEADLRRGENPRISEEKWDVSGV